ncbi:MAG: hypothetical protein AAGK21_08255 [Bacteroidota bacterium]
MFIRVVEEYVPVAEETIGSLTHTSCPNGGITFTLLQRTVDSGFIYKATEKASGIAVCASSGEEIPPMAWTEDMEHAFEALQARTDLVAETRVSIWGKLLFGLAAFLIVAIPVGLYTATSDTSYEDQQARIEAVLSSPAVGDYLETNSGDLSDRTTMNFEQKQWYVIRELGAEIVTLQAYGETFDVYDRDPFDAPDLSPAGFTGETIEVPSESFLQYERITGDVNSPFLISNAVDTDG